MEDSERFGRLEVRMDRVEAGIANFRDFQQDARDFFAEHRATEAEREKQLNKRDQEIKDALERHYRSNERRQWWIMFSVAIVGIIVAIAFGLMTVPPAIQSVRDLLKSNVHWEHLFTNVDQTLAHNSIQISDSQ